MATNNTLAMLAIMAIPLGLGAGCRKAPGAAQAAESPVAAAPPPAVPAKARPLTAAQVGTLQRYDGNRDGQLDPTERARMDAEHKERIDLLKGRINARYDKNGNGVLDPDEVRAMQADTDKLSVFRGAAMRRYDANHDGVLDADEKDRMKAEQRTFLNDMRTRTLAKYDTNRDGKLDIQERAAMDRQLAPAAAPTK